MLEFLLGAGIGEFIMYVIVGVFIGAVVAFIINEVLGG